MSATTKKIGSYKGWSIIEWKYEEPSYTKKTYKGVNYDFDEFEKLSGVISSGGVQTNEFLDLNECKAAIDSKIEDGVEVVDVESLGGE